MPTTYRTLKRQFNLDDVALEDLKAELLFTHPQIVDEDGRGSVWADDTGSVTELIADLDTEAARQLLDPALQHMMAAVHRYEGTVNQVLGNGIMALFGAPLAHEDHALRACYAALAMQAALRRYGEEVRRSHGLEMHMRVGLNSGEVVVRTISNDLHMNDLHMDYSAVGQTTHLAARMEQLAPPGCIRLTAATLRLVDGLVQVQALGRFPVKGLPEPVEVFELTGASAIHRRLQAVAARGLTRFVGRHHEIETLRQALEQAAAGHGQLVAIVGEAGVGKSRLVYEFTQADVSRTWLVLEGASVSYGKATPYSPVLDLLRRYMHLEERDEARTIRAKVTGYVLTLDAALQDIIPALLALLEVASDDSPFLKLDPAQRRQRTLDALKRLLLRESQVQPLLLVFEDLHWIDAETQALLDSLVGSLPTARLLLLANYRPEYQHGWGSKTYYAQLRLDPLPPASAAEVLAALLGDDPSLAPLTQLLMARTEGNPFFLEESVRTLAETGILVGERGAYRLAHALPTIQVPATVQAVLAARIDLLPPEEKTLLQTAAAIGTEVPVPLLQAIAELSEAVLYRSLEHLQAAEFLYETRLFPEQVCTFKHALTHEVAYSSLLHERRRVLHARIAETLEKMVGDRVAEQVEHLAYHALRGAVWDKALAYFRQAGEKAMARSAHREAVGYFEQAISVLTHLPETRDMREQAIDLRRTLHNALFPSGNFEHSRVALHEAESLAMTLDDPRRLGQISLGLSTHFHAIGVYDQAIAAAQRALALATADGDVVLHAMANDRLGLAYQAQGDYRQAITGFRQSAAFFDGARRHERFGRTILPAVLSRAWLAVCHAELGTFAEGLVFGEEGCRIAEAVDHPFSLMLASWGIGLLALYQGDLSMALPLLERAVGICREADFPTFFPSMAAALGAAYTVDGRVNDAVPLLTQALE